MLDLEGKYIRTFNSVAEAERHINATSYIGGALSGKQKSAFGYKWRYSKS